MDVTGLPLLSAITFVPLVGAILIAFIPRRNPGLVRATALGASLVSWALSLLLLVGFLPSHPNFQFVERADWIPPSGSSTSWASTACRSPSSSSRQR